MANFGVNLFFHSFFISFATSVIWMPTAIANPGELKVIELSRPEDKLEQFQLSQAALPIEEFEPPSIQENSHDQVVSMISSEIALTGSATDLISDASPTTTAEVSQSPIPTTSEFDSTVTEPELAESELLEPELTEPGLTESDLSEPADEPFSDSPDDYLLNQAEAEDEQNEGWEFLLEPYVFLPFNVEADVTVGGRSASLDANLSDIFNLDRIFAASLRFQGRRDRFGFIIDGSYLFGQEETRQEVTIPEEAVAQFGLTDDLTVRANTTVTSRLATIDLAGFYRIVDSELGKTETGAETYPRLFIDTIAGLRINILSLDLEIDSISVNNIDLDDQDLDSSITLLEPLLGGRIGLDLSDRWSLGLRGDVSGFGINGDENLTWNVLVGTQYWLSRSTALQMAYRFTEFVYEDGDDEDTRGLDLSQNGLWLGLMFRL